MTPQERIRIENLEIDVKRLIRLHSKNRYHLTVSIRDLIPTFVELKTEVKGKRKFTFNCKCLSLRTYKTMCVTFYTVDDKLDTILYHTDPDNEHVITSRDIKRINLEDVLGGK